MLNDPNLPEDHPINKIDPHIFARNNPGKFAAKLQFADRCAILALFKSNIARSVLALAYGVDRRTINHIVSDTSPHYRDVRKEALRLGDAEFRRCYIRESDTEKVNATREHPEAKETYHAIDQKNAIAVATTRTRGPNHRATSHRGVHPVQLQRGETHRIEIDWVTLDVSCSDDIVNTHEGWFWRDLTDDAEQWLGCDDGKPANTSLECLRWVENNAY